MRKTLLSYILIAVLAAFIMALSTGCEEEKKPETKPAEKKTTTEKAPPTEADKNKEAEEAKAKKQAEEAAANIDAASKLHDPFRSFFTDMIANKDTKQCTNPDPEKCPQGGDKGPESPLQQYEVSTFMVKAIIFGVANPIAILQDPTGKTHSVKVGQAIGRNWGKVIKIMKDGVVVDEQLTNNTTGQRQINTITLPLKGSAVQTNPVDVLVDAQAGSGGGQAIPMLNQGGKNLPSSNSTNEDDRLKRFQNIIDQQQSYQKMWQTPTTGGSGGGEKKNIPGQVP